MLDELISVEAVKRWEMAVRKLGSVIIITSRIRLTETNRTQNAVQAAIGSPIYGRQEPKNPISWMLLSSNGAR
jgi:hypothetical protein